MSETPLPRDYTGVVEPADWTCGHCRKPRAAHACAFHRPKYDFVAMLRVKNESRWIVEVIQALLPLCGLVFVFDDHSEDDTVTLSQQQGSQMRVMRSPFSGLNEARDKNYLYDQIERECEAGWILCIDGDEVLEKRGPDIIRMWCRDHDRAESGVTAGRFKVEYLWNDPNTLRVDRIYSDFWRPSLFKPFHADPNKPDDLKVLTELRWKTTPFGKTLDGNEPNLHCSSVPQRFLGHAPIVPVRLKHYGYMDRAHRVAKLDWYTSIDWKNDAEDWYRHMVQGDSPVITETPKIEALIRRGVMGMEDFGRLGPAASQKLMHAGPLKLAPWDEDAQWFPTDWARRLR